ncbi:MAG: porphobilinogen synthase [Alphaproteobacteria bacterium]
MPTPRFPLARPRRNRSAGWWRDMVQEHRLHVSDLIWPVFILPGEGQEEPVESMPGVTRRSVDLLVEAARETHDLGIGAVALFPVTPPDLKDPMGGEATNPDNLACQAARALKAALPDLGVICDVALDPYTSHGHDGIIRGDEIVNDETVSILVRQSVVQADAGVDIIAPSDMMDGRIAAIRQGLDKAGHSGTGIMAYSAKYASAYYGPFRDAVGSSGALKGDKKTYQMNPANTDEALREVAMDLDEGADMVMVKPGLPYLDIIRRVRERFEAPVFAYHVSGEYAMLKAAAANGWLDHDAVLMETLLAFKRAGCSGILTYGAVDAARLLQSR